MKRPVGMKIVVMFLLGIFALGGLCLVQQAKTLGLAGDMPGGCHGHHKQMPVSSHSCCYAKPQPAAQVQISPVLAELNPDAAGVALSNPRASRVFLTVSIGAKYFSPPTSVLRI
jgi:hypothetical protein